VIQITIITVVLDNMAFIKDAIESVVCQKNANIQYIIIDGGSNDGSLEIINSFGDKISIVISEPDEGIYDAMNKGLALATGDIIGFLNADDFYAHSQVIEKVVARFNTEQCDALYADLDYVSRTDKNKIVRKWRSGIFAKNRFVKGWMPPHPTFFVRKEVYQKLGGFNKQLHMAADYELMLRFCYFNNIKVTYLPEVIIKMRLGGQSNRSFKNRVKANIQDRNAWVMNGVNPKWYTLLLKPLSKIKQYFL
jgi:glycosyltransferase involved in cell wall biosynthesis